MTGSALVYQAFDSDAFGVPFYRLADRADPRLPPRLADEIAALSAAGPVVVDAKLAEHERDATAALKALGFRPVCMQIGLSHDLETDGTMRGSSDVRIVPRLDLDAATLRAHARGFRFARFLQDPCLPRAASQRLMARWIANSLGGRRSVAALGHDFCSFEDRGREVVIDLLSCLETGKGHATALLQAVLAHARDQAAGRVRVVTEAENRRSLAVYERNGFRRGGRFVVLHLVHHPAWAAAS